MDQFTNAVLLGVGIGAIYAVLAQGIVLIYRGSGVLNFAHGAYAMVGAYAFDELIKDTPSQFLPGPAHDVEVAGVRRRRAPHRRPRRPHRPAGHGPAQAGVSPGAHHRHARRPGRAAVGGDAAVRRGARPPGRVAPPRESAEVLGTTVGRRPPVAAGHRLRADRGALRRLPLHPRRTRHECGGRERGGGRRPRLVAGGAVHGELDGRRRPRGHRRHPHRTRSRGSTSPASASTSSPPSPLPSSGASRRSRSRSLAAS